MVFGLSRNPEKYEARALNYEQKGKTAKAIKNREKAAKLRAQQANTTTTHGVPLAGTTMATPITTLPLGTPVGTTTTVPLTTTGLNQQPYGLNRTPAMYEQRALKWEQRNNWDKAQKNRAKVWRMNNPQYMNSAQYPAPTFYNQNRFLGYNVPYTAPTGFATQPAGYAQPVGYANQTQFVNSTWVPSTYKSSPFSQFGSSRRDPAKYEAKAADYERRGKPKKALKLREKAAKLRANNGQYTQTRTIPMYEANALKWEQRGNWNKAQKNREKVWRLQNPQYMNTTQYVAPSFYDKNRFIGYNAFHTYGNQGMGMPATGLGMPATGLATHSHTNAPIVETHVRPTIVEQTARPERIVEVQPVIHREIDAPQVRVIEKHVYETVPSAGPAVITKQAIVEETVKPRIIEEVQPVVHREVPAPYVERVEQHVTEHVARPTVTTKEVVNQPGVAVAAGGMPINAQANAHARPL